MASLNISGDAFPEWNYTITPRTTDRAIVLR